SAGKMIQREIPRALVLNLLWQSKRCSSLPRISLSLTAPSLLSMESTLHSPVDLLLEGRLIAQGEVVIVDGKYGLRITAVVDTAPAFGSPA
ncbi:MAG: FliM/FliN family flagellar motor switch protein, partial [Terriglobales bacterium]